MINLSYAALNLFQDTRPQCSIRVVPIAGGARGVAGGSFHVFRYPEGSPVVYAQHVTTGEFLEDRAVLTQFGKVLREVDGIALDETRSRDLIARVASEYERQPDDSGAADEGRPRA